MFSAQEAIMQIGQDGPVTGQNPVPTVPIQTQQAKPASQPIPAAPAVMDPNMLYSLVQLLLAERQDAMEERKEKRRAHEAREAMRRKSSEYNEADVRHKQSICTHKKGCGRGSVRGSKLDYAVYFHTFIDQSSQIRCQICGAKWKKNDTAEFLYRRGERIPNWTGIGWTDALKMLNESTNVPSSSEVKLTANPLAFNEPDFKADPYAIEI